MRKVDSDPVAIRNRSGSLSGQNVKTSLTQERSDDFSDSLHAISNAIGDIMLFLDATSLVSSSNRQKPFDALDVLNKLLGVKSSFISDIGIINLQLMFSSLLSFESILISPG